MAARRPLPVVLLGLVTCAAPAPRTGSVASNGSPTASDDGPSRVQPVFATARELTNAPPADACRRTVHPFRQPVALTNDADVDRYPPVVGFPIAFPKAAGLGSTSGFFASTLDGLPLATQVEVLSRFGDGPGACGAPVRWMYGYTIANAPRGRAFFNIEHRPGFDPPLPHRLIVTEDEMTVVIDTAVARFTVRKDWFNGLSRAELFDGRRYRTVMDVPSTADAGMLILEKSKLASPINGKLLSFELERAGPVVATVAAKGTYALRGEPEIYRYTMRMHFYAGTATVQFDHTYYNGEAINISATGAINRKAVDRVFMRLPLTLGGQHVVTARAATKLHGVTPKSTVSVQQDKRSPSRPNVVFAVRHGKTDLELGTFADDPMLAVTGTTAYAVATIAHLAHRDPQALRYEPKANALEIDWQSERMFVGGARGIWSKAAIDFGQVGRVDPSVRAGQLKLHIERPLIAVPNVAYLNTTKAYGALPSGGLPSRYAKLDDDIDKLHASTALYLRQQRITGTQIWPDLPRTSCTATNVCRLSEEGFFTGGDSNYWDWSLVELESFLRTSDPAFVHDFALAEAITMAETVSYRPNWYDKSGTNSFAGFSPCYGGGDQNEQPWKEGMNHRIGNCPGDYGYNKVHRLAYILTADRRFLDYFEQGADTVVRLYSKNPKDRPPHWFELSPSRQTSQYLEPLAAAAEFAKSGDEKNRERRDIMLRWFDFMKQRALERGHTCILLGSGFSNPRLKGECYSPQQWMLPVFVDWVQRLYYLYGHEPAREWLVQFAQTSPKHATELDADGVPNYGARNSGDGWRTVYKCPANKSGIQDDECTKVTDWENNNYFYANGMLAYLNALALVREVDPKDEAKLCRWLPEAYASALSAMNRTELNDYTWGKSPAQAYAFSQRALAGLMMCSL